MARNIGRAARVDTGTAPIFDGRPMSTTTPQAGTITMFTTSWCGYCRQLKRQLDRESITYREVNIEEDPAAASYVEQVNGGNRTVPTVLFPDDTAATNPSLAEVKADRKSTRLNSSHVRISYAVFCL